MDEKKTGKQVLVGNTQKKVDKDNRKEWKKPTFEDVSERVMAQPYIRFT